MLNTELCLNTCAATEASREPMGHKRGRNVIGRQRRLQVKHDLFIYLANVGTKIKELVTLYRISQKVSKSMLSNLFKRIGRILMN